MALKGAKRNAPGSAGNKFCTPDHRASFFGLRTVLAESHAQGDDMHDTSYPVLSIPVDGNSTVTPPPTPTDSRPSTSTALTPTFQTVEVVGMFRDIARRMDEHQRDTHLWLERLEDFV
ncbi:unnamed protein product [Ilex paraguariensis]|uniref:Uncharacterized protein n=1 Tax=Ilex paraguariensis TaxID=185542 RepID=A0ABC8TG26_9AQUA